MISGKILPGCARIISSCRNLSTKVSCEEIRIPVPWGHIAGKWWGPTDKRPVLTLHGWQDNCGSFDRIIPLLNKDLGFLAIDFPGHGLSSRYPTGIFYHFPSYLILVHIIAKYFQWEKTSLLGHSLGGITSYMYGMIYPELVDFVICIDGAKPMIRKNNNIHMAQTIDRFLKYSKYDMSIKEPPSYTMEEIKQKICAPNKGSVLPEYADYLITRNIAKSKVNPGKYYFTRDPRLKSGNLINFPQNEIVEYAQKMHFPIFIAKAKQASYYEVKENFYEVIDVLKRASRDCDFQYFEGTHHVHLNNPEILAAEMTKFIRRNNIEDRSVGGISDKVKIVQSLT